MTSASAGALFIPIPRLSKVLGSTYRRSQIPVADRVHRGGLSQQDNASDAAHRVAT
jgi:hypothetical protein